jgi:hypothetical protein
MASKGLIIKPLIGVFDVVDKFTDGLLNFITVFDDKENI